MVHEMMTSHKSFESAALKASMCTTILACKQTELLTLHVTCKQDGTQIHITRQRLHLPTTHHSLSTILQLLLLRLVTLKKAVKKLLAL
jgi:hypothetical protein